MASCDDFVEGKVYREEYEEEKVTRREGPKAGCHCTGRHSSC